MIPDNKERFRQETMEFEIYPRISKAIDPGGRIKEHYEVKENLLCWKGQALESQKTRKKTINSECNLKVAGNCGSKRTLESISMIDYCRKIEDGIRDYCNECD
jgi:hypothetical protein